MDDAIQCSACPTKVIDVSEFETCCECGDRMCKTCTVTMFGCNYCPKCANDDGYDNEDDEDE